MTNSTLELTTSFSSNITSERRNFIQDLELHSLAAEKRVFPKTKQTLVVIDSSVDDWQMLAAGVKDNAQVFILDRQQNGIEQLNSIIRNNPHITSLHLVSHGTPGSLQLGNTEFSTETLEQHKDALQSWSSYLAKTSLLIYGCRVAQGDIGELFLQRLHHLTKANIAASTRKVGHITKNGSWLLDYQLGQVNQELAFSTETTQCYQGTFEPIVKFFASPDVLIEEEETVLTFKFELSEPPPAEGINITFFGDQTESLSQLDVFKLKLDGISTFSFPDLVNTGLTVTVVDQVASLSSPIFQDNAFYPDGPETSDPVFNTPNVFESDDFIVNYFLVEGEGYTIDPNQNSGIVSFVDDFNDVPDDEPPEVANALADVTTDKNAENTVIDLSNVFTDIDDEDNAILKIVSNNTNENLVQATIENNTLTLDYQDNQSGTAEITIQAESNGKTVEDSFSVTINPDEPIVDDPPEVANALADVTTEKNAENTVIDLSNVFTDIDNEDNAILKIVSNNTNENLVQATIENNTLILNYQDNQSGTAEITIQGESNGKIVEDSFSVTVIDPILPNITISDVALAEGNEGETTFSFDVLLSEARDVPVAVKYSTTDDTAIAGNDYIAITDSELIFEPGETSKTINVQVIGDNEVEENETFLVNLSNATNANITDDQGVGTIKDDDDEPPIVSIELAEDATDTLIESESTETTLVITLDEPPPEEGLVVNIATGKEFSLGDFVPLPQRPQALTGASISLLPAGNSAIELLIEEQTATLTLEIIDDPDRSPEDPEAGRSDDIGLETTTFFIEPKDDYNINEEASSVTLTLVDEPSQLPEPGTINPVTIANAEGIVESVFYDGTSLLDSANAKLTDNVLDLGVEAAFDNLVGFYEIVDVNGGIDTNDDGNADLLPGDEGYARTAIESRIRNWHLRAGSSGDSGKNTTVEQFGDIAVAGGALYAPFVIANGGIFGFDGFLAFEDQEGDGQFNEAAKVRDDIVAYFSFIGANPDGAKHIEARGDNIFGFEDLPANLGGSDNDFNDAVFRFDFSIN